MNLEEFQLISLSVEEAILAPIKQIQIHYNIPVSLQYVFSLHSPLSWLYNLTSSLIH